MTNAQQGPLRLGIDVGGTNTDAVLMSGNQVLSTSKIPTSPDVISGIGASVSAATAGHDVSRVDRVIIGTTHFINAVVQARSLAPVAAIRLCTAPASLPPFLDWPSALRAAVDGGVHACSGGYQFDGRLLNPLDEGEIGRVAQELDRTGHRNVAVTGVFSPLAGEQESRVAEILTDMLPGVSITLSHQIGRIGVLERENAALLNESLRPMAGQVVDGLADAIADLGISAGLYLTQNDGTVMSLDRARRYPITTIASGPTNSMRGAAFLSGLADAVVVDVGGTTTDIGLLRNGFPRESAVAKDLGGVRSNFRIPEVTSLGIGGGSVVHRDGDRLVGPDSVGFRLTSEALVFGGTVTTLTDVAVAAGLAVIGDPALAAHLPADLVRDALAEVNERIFDAVEEAKLSDADLPVVIVGGGAQLISPRTPPERLIRPTDGGSANAVGATLGSIGGEVDRIYSLAEQSRADALTDARDEAIKLALRAGARAGSVSIVDEEDIPLSHLPGGSALRIRVKAVGALDTAGSDQERTTSCV
ncbi:hydantoinase/oxoprolinase N-terminal domain-containing protein [Nakamurella lactea]|uniref:hydantoinase/oxoprolinase N-terminal domain-containing protein n=1 Tax=Nakamurella lactea TaxID=459515 RepID=UPI000413070D|nr:hydantoinase/oxoprolinase family protein [Nakamurella lactea]